MKEHREKGLCFSCNSKWSPSHCCQSPKLYLIKKAKEVEEIIFKRPIQLSHQQPNEGLLLTLDQPEIFLQAIIGSLSPKTMRVKGKIGGQWVTILIDSANTHNFLDLAVVSKIPLLVMAKDTVWVRIANGDQVESEGKLLGVSVLIQGAIFSVDLYVLVLASCDMMLGVQ